MTQSQQAKNKRAGQVWESLLRDEFRREGFLAERLRTTGKHDEGDLVLDGNGQLVVVEAKAGKLYPAEFVRQACIERDNYCRARGLNPAEVDAVAIVKARGKSWKDAYVLTTVRDYFGLS